MANALKNLLNEIFERTMREAYPDLCDILYPHQPETTEDLHADLEARIREAHNLILNQLLGTPEQVVDDLNELGYPIDSQPTDPDHADMHYRLIDDLYPPRPM